MTQPEAAFGDVRSLLQHAPEQARWEALCALLDQFDADTLARELVPYAQGMLRPWDSMLRVAPKRWVLRILSGEEVPQATLATAVRLSYHALGRQDAARLGRAPSLLRITTLSLWDVQLDAFKLDALFGEGTLPRRLARVVLTHNKLDAEALRHLTTSTQCTTLGALELPNNALGDIESARLLSEAPCRETIEELDLSDNPLDAAFVSELGRCGPWLSLRHLNLHNTRLHERPEAIGAALDRLGAGHLEELDLSGDPIGDEGASALADTLTLNRLTALDLRGSMIGGEGLHALWQSPTLDRLERLDLSNNPLGAGMMMDRRSGPRERLQLLNLAHCGLVGEPIRALARSQALCGVRDLDLSHNQLEDEDVIALLLDEALSGVERLRLNHNHLTPASISKLVRSPQLARARVLDLSHNVVGDRGALALAHAEELAQLHTLKLANARLTEDGLNALASSPHLSRLDHLDLNGNHITQRAARALADSPHLKPHIRDRWLKNFPAYKKW